MPRQFSDKQLVQLIERRSPHHPRCIDYDHMRALLEGRLQLPQPIPEGELPPDHYRVRATGVLPEFARLNGELYGWAAPQLNGLYDWKLHGDNMYRDMTPCDRLFFLKRFPRTTVEMANLWGDEHGYWSGTHTDVVDLGRDYPYPAWWEGRVLGAGSSVDDGRGQGITALSANGQSLDFIGAAHVFGPGDLFLFVSKMLLGRSEP